MFEAPDLKRARTAAKKALEERAQGEDKWSLGVLKPLTPRAPGTHCYRIVYAVWEAEGDFFEKLPPAARQELQALFEDSAARRFYTFRDVRSAIG